MMETDEKLKRLKAIRSGNRGVVTKYIKEAIELLNDEDKSTDTTDRLNTIEKLLTEKVELLKELDVKILDMSDVENIVQEINETEEVYSRVCDVRVKISKFSSESMVTNGKDIVQGVESNTTEGNTDTQNHSQVSEAIFTPASLQDTNTNLVEDTNTQITNTQISSPNTQ